MRFSLRLAAAFVLTTAVIAWGLGAHHRRWGFAGV
jgi:hypothetical protein